MTLMYCINRARVRVAPSTETNGCAKYRPLLKGRRLSLYPAGVQHYQGIISHAHYDFDESFIKRLVKTNLRRSISSASFVLGQTRLRMVNV